MVDQDLLFGPAKEAATAQMSAEHEAARKELSQAQSELQREKDLRQSAIVAHQAQVAEVEGHRETAVQAAAVVQAENLDLKKQLSGMFLDPGCSDFVFLLVSGCLLILPLFRRF